MKKVFDMPSILLESFQTEEAVMTELNPLSGMGIDFEWNNT